MVVSWCYADKVSVAVEDEEDDEEEEEDEGNRNKQMNCAWSNSSEHTREKEEGAR